MTTKSKDLLEVEPKKDKKSALNGKSSSASGLTSRVEQFFHEQSKRKLMYAPTEKIPVIEVPNFPTLGRLTALRFLEWVQQNPEGVISLPTGKTPEYFIKWSQHYLNGWTKKEIQKELGELGLETSKKPELKGLRFVQIDEFYPIDPNQQNSFYYYVNKHYLRGFGMDPSRALLINPAQIGIPTGHTIDTIWPGGQVDLTLRSRVPKTDLEKLQYEVILAVDQFCSEYEQQIRDWGGLGFFLGGIGPDGHIGFNPRGASLQSPTRLTYTNYETEAAAAGDLGGIEVSRQRPVITIGLSTITYNPNCVAIIFAAGEAKSKIVRDAIQQEKDVRYPASVLQGMANARFYLTHGATVKLTERIIDNIQKADKVTAEEVEKRVIDRAISLQKKLDQLTDKDAKDDPILTAALDRTGQKLTEAAKKVRASLIAKIEEGTRKLENTTILHTGPHHDDIMLGYMNYILHLVREQTNKNYFTVLTSGFTAVTNRFLASVLEDLSEALDKDLFSQDAAEGAFLQDNTAPRAEEVYRFLDGIAARDERECKRWQARRMLYNLMVVFEDEDIDHLRERIGELLNYLYTVYPGKKDIKIVQTLKGMQREFEEELIWGYVGIGPDMVFHGRLGFYTGDIFTRQPTQDRDVDPVLKMYHNLKPDVVTLAFDPEGTGPDTHYKVLQVLHEALLQYEKQTGKAPEVWGYRNVWHRFHPADANCFIPMSLNSMAVMEQSFMWCFGSQKNASFPSFEYDGPFCYQAQAVFTEQFRTLRTLLGHEYFEQNPSARLRAARGFVYIKKMPLKEFSGQARKLAEITETGA